MAIPKEFQDWIADLRSGKYVQGLTCLGNIELNEIRTDVDFSSSVFCCLGVYAFRYVDTVYKDVISNWHAINRDYLSCSYLHGMARINFDKLLYFNSQDRQEVHDRFLTVIKRFTPYKPSVIDLQERAYLNSFQETLADLNDNSVSFETIADILEAFFTEHFANYNELPQSQANN